MTLVPPNTARGGYPLGLAGATAATRYVGATTSGAPASGTFAVGDFVIDQSGALYVCTVAGSPGTWSGVGGSALNVTALLRDLKSSGTNGGSFASGAWRTRDLNDETDPGGIVSLAANAFTLQAGTYLIDASAPAALCNQHQIRLQNTSDATTPLTGSPQFCSTGLQSNSFLLGELTIAAAKVFEIQHQCTTTRNTDGFGVAGGFSVSEVYTQVRIVKLA